MSNMEKTNKQLSEDNDRLIAWIRADMKTWDKEDFKMARKILKKKLFKEEEDT